MLFGSPDVIYCEKINLGVTPLPLPLFGLLAHPVGGGETEIGQISSADWRTEGRTKGFRLS